MKLIRLSKVCQFSQAVMSMSTSLSSNLFLFTQYHFISRSGDQILLLTEQCSRMFVPLRCTVPYKVLKSSYSLETVEVNAESQIQCEQGKSEIQRLMPSTSPTINLKASLVVLLEPSNSLIVNRRKFVILRANILRILKSRSIL